MALTGLWPNIAALVGVPVVVWLTSTGLGLLAERLIGTRMPNALLPPLGFCAAVIVCLGVYTSGASNVVLLPVLAALVFVGFLIQRRELLARLNAGWPLVAGIACYLLFDGSVIATGHWTFVGYHLQDDSAYELLLVRHLQTWGTQAAGLPPSTASSYISSFLSTGYPLGTQSYLAAISGLLHADPAVIWQGYLSSIAGVGAMAAATMSERFLDRRLGALVGVLAVSSALTYQYAMQGGIKEIGVMVAVICSLALIRWAILNLRGMRAAVMVATPLAAILATYNAAGAPFALAIAGMALLGAVLTHRRLPSRTWVVPSLAGVALFGVLAAPALTTFLTFLRVSTALYASGSQSVALPLGQLLRPLPLSEVAGIWLANDYRVPVPPGLAGTIEVLATVAMLAMLLLGSVRALLRREPGLLMAVGTAGLVLLIVYPRSIPYAQAKILAIISPIVVLGAAQGLATMRSRALLPIAIALGGALGAGVLLSDALAYHHDPVAPTSRFVALREVGQALGDRGPVLVSEFEEFAKYFAAPARLDVGTEYPSPENLVMRAPGGLYGQSFDLDEEQLSFVESFPYVLVRRSPAASRPPANYHLVYENRYYEVWRRSSTPKVIEHLPLQQRFSATAPIGCSELRAIVHKVPRDSRLVVSLVPNPVGYELAKASTRSAGWILNPNPYFPDTITPTTPGIASNVVHVPRAGTYRVWVQGTFPRPTTVSLDGHEVSSMFGNNTPDEWMEGGTVYARAGRHRLALSRGGGGLAPGDGGTGIGDGGGEIGYLALVPDQQRKLVSVPLAAWHSLCGRTADWVEVVKK